MSDPPLRQQNYQRLIDRALGDLRRGLPIVIFDGDAAAICIAPETATSPWIQALADWPCAEPFLALTRRRAAALNILPSGDDIVFIGFNDWFGMADAAGLADATTDLEMPMRGPWKRSLRASTAIDHAAIQMMKVGYLLPAAIIAPIEIDDVTGWAQKEDLMSVPATAIFDYEQRAAATLTEIAAAKVPLADAENCRIRAFRPADGGREHLALIIGEPDRSAPVLVRLHSECLTGDILGSLKCDCGQQLRGAIHAIEKAGAGILLYLAQEGRGIGLINKLRAYRLQEDGFDTVDANERLGFEVDERVFQPAAEILAQLGVDKIQLLTNNPDKVAGLENHGIAVATRVPLQVPTNRHNEAYLSAKRERTGHLL